MGHSECGFLSVCLLVFLIIASVSLFESGVFSAAEARKERVLCSVTRFVRMKTACLLHEWGHKQCLHCSCTETGQALHICRNWTSTKLEKWKSIAHAQKVKLEGIAYMLKLDKYIAHVSETRHVLHLCRNWTHTAHACSPNSLCSHLSGQHQCGTLRLPLWATVEIFSFQWRQGVLYTSQAMSLCVAVKY